LRSHRGFKIKVFGACNRKIRPVTDSATEKPIQEDMLAVGEGRILDNGDVRPLDVKTGGRVLYGKYSGT
jgi:co-chaperonin GroES (HSP10)